MSNVRKGMGGDNVPEIYRGEGYPGGCKYPPETIKHEVSGASGKAKMNFTHPPLGPEQHYVDSEEGGAMLPAAEGDKGEHGEPGHHADGDGKKPRHRSTSGVPGHTLTGN
jgi:hypothetical protein